MTTRFRFRFARLLVGFPLLALGASLPLISFLPWAFYVAGCTLALLGGWILARGLRYPFTGVGFALVGFPLLLFAMRPGSFDFLTRFGFEPGGLFVTRLTSCILSTLVLCASFQDDE